MDHLLNVRKSQLPNFKSFWGRIDGKNRITAFEIFWPLIRSFQTTLDSKDGLNSEYVGDFKLGGDIDKKDPIYYVISIMYS